jgi:AbrB family looped-hinge helix DNA binding protein
MELRVRTRVGEKGRILIPAAIRERLGVMIGDPVVLEVEDDVLRIRSLEARLARTRARLRQFATPGKLMSASLIAERREEASRE